VGTGYQDQDRDTCTASSALTKVEPEHVYVGTGTIRGKMLRRKLHEHTGKMELEPYVCWKGLDRRALKMFQEKCPYKDSQGENQKICMGK
jgi:hypothetical protein